MRYPTVIVEDSARSRQTLAHLLQAYCPSVEVIGGAASTAEAVAEIQRLRPQMVMLDIELSPGNGFAVLEKLAPIDFEVIFTTAYDQYALKAIKFSALDYLLKPINIKELISAVSKAVERLRTRQMQERYESLMTNLQDSRQKPNSLAVPTAEGFEMVKVSDIIRCEGDEGYTHLVIRGPRTIVTTRRLKDWEEILEEHGFFRIHRSHLINLDFLKRYHKGQGGYVEMHDGAHLDVSRRRKEAFIQQLNGWS